MKIKYAISLFEYLELKYPQSSKVLICAWKSSLITYIRGMRFSTLYLSISYVLCKSTKMESIGFVLVFNVWLWNVFTVKIYFWVTKWKMLISVIFFFFFFVFISLWSAAVLCGLRLIYIGFAFSGSPACSYVIAVHFWYCNFWWYLGHICMAFFIILTSNILYGNLNELFFLSSELSFTNMYFCIYS